MVGGCAEENRWGRLTHNEKASANSKHGSQKDKRQDDGLRLIQYEAPVTVVWTADTVLFLRAITDSIAAHCIHTHTHTE